MSWRQGVRASGRQGVRRIGCQKPKRRNSSVTIEYLEWTTFLLSIMLARYLETPYDLIIITYFEFLYTVFMTAVKGRGIL